MTWGTYISEWIHILLGIFWFGSAMYVNFLLRPTMMKAGPAAMGDLMSRLIGSGEKVLVPLGYATVAMGFIRGTFFGRIRSADILLHTRYGNVWLVALGLGAGVALWSQFVLVPTGRKMIGLMSSMPQMAMAGMPFASVPGGASPETVSMAGGPPAPPPEVQAVMKRGLIATGVELLGFFAIFTCMVILNFS